MCWLRSALALLLLIACSPIPQALAETDPSSASVAGTASLLQSRADQLPALLSGDVAIEDYFTPEFLASVPPLQVSAIIASLKEQYGKVQALQKLDQRNATSGTAFVTFEKAVGQFRITIDPAQQGRVAGLLITGFSVSDDSITSILQEIRSLPGSSGVLAVRLDGKEGHEIFAHNSGTAFAIGSTFKLYILAELAAQIRRGKLGWDRVTTIERRSFTSPATEYWPSNGPVTLHTLASWMISVSDNAASDNLLDIVGRDAVGRRLQSIGNSVADRNLPFLNTVEAFALKAPANDDLRARFLSANETEQRRLIDQEQAKLTLETIQGEMFVGKPLHIDSAEWFAAPRDLVRLMLYFRDMPDPTARTILAINPGISRDAASQWSYVGYKGGSESGVISMSYLLQTKAGHWYALTASWNDSGAPVDNGKFAGLMQRLVAQLLNFDAAASTKS